MKRLLAILAIAAAGLLAACGQGGSTSTDGGLETFPATSAEAPSVGVPASPAESMPLESASPSS